MTRFDAESTVTPVQLVMAVLPDQFSVVAVPRSWPFPCNSQAQSRMRPVWVVSGTTAPFEQVVTCAGFGVGDARLTVTV